MRLLRVSLKWIWILTGNSPQPRRVKWKGGSLRTHKHQRVPCDAIKYKENTAEMLHADYFKNNNNLSAGPDWEFIISGNQSVKVPSSFSHFEAKAFHPHTTRSGLIAFRCTPVRAYTSCISLSTPHQGCLTASIDVLPLQSSAFAQCQSVSREVCWERRNRPVGGAYGLRQEVSWNSQEGTVWDEKCWVIKVIIYSKTICKTQILCHPWRI